jgi:hypothetical protein
VGRAHPSLRQEPGRKGRSCPFPDPLHLVVFGEPSAIDLAVTLLVVAMITGQRRQGPGRQRLGTARAPSAAPPPPPPTEAPSA